MKAYKKTGDFRASNPGVSSVRAGLVLGFGYGQANHAIADFASGRHRADAFQVILAQEAPLVKLQQILPDAAIGRMHAHGTVYVNTLDALGFGLLQLSTMETFRGPWKIEILSHDLQFNRAIETAKRAIRWLKRTPSPPVRFAQFMESVTLVQTQTPPPMLLNLWRESWRQPWTCHRLLYHIAAAVASRRDFSIHGNRYDAVPDAFYDHLIALIQKTGKAD